MTRESGFRLPAAMTLGVEAIDKLQDLQESKYRLRSLFNRAQSLVGFMGGALIFIDTGTEKLDLPLNICGRFQLRSRKIPTLSFALIDPINVSPGLYNSVDPLKSDYMRPAHWYVFQRAKSTPTRLLRLVDNEPPQLLKPAYNFFGIPQAQILWDYVSALEQGSGSRCKHLRQAESFGFQDGFCSGFYRCRRYRAARTGKCQLLQRYRDNDSVFACDSTEDVQNITATIAGVTDIIRQSLEFSTPALIRTPASEAFGYFAERL